MFARARSTIRSRRRHTGSMIRRVAFEEETVGAWPVESGSGVVAG